MSNPTASRPEKFGGKVKITAEMLEVILGLPTGVRLVDVVFNQDRDIAEFKLQSAGPTRVTRRVREGQEYPVETLMAEDVTRVRVGLVREVFE